MVRGTGEQPPGVTSHESISSTVLLLHLIAAAAGELRKEAGGQRAAGCWSFFYFFEFLLICHCRSSFMLDDLVVIGAAQSICTSTVRTLSLESNWRNFTWPVLLCLLVNPRQALPLPFAGKVRTPRRSVAPPRHLLTRMTLRLRPRIAAYGNVVLRPLRSKFSFLWHS